MANAVTITRLILLPVFLVLLLVSGYNYTAFGVFVLAAFSDWLDGFLARRRNEVTEFGKIADPTIDRLFIVCTVIALYIKSKVPPFWAVSLLVFRDLFLAVGFLWLLKKDKRIVVTYLGKVATTFLFVAFALFILKPELKPEAGIFIFYPGLILYLLAGIDYAVKAVKSLKIS